MRLMTEILSRKGVCAVAVLALGWAQAVTAEHYDYDYDYSGPNAAGCEVTTKKEKMDMAGRELAYFPDTADDAECFSHCLQYFGYDYEDYSEVRCSTTVRRVNGDCYLHSQTIDEAVPSKMRTYVSYCVQVDECTPETVAEDCSFQYVNECEVVTCKKDGEFRKCGVESGNKGQTCEDYDQRTCGDVCNAEGNCAGTPCPCDVTTTREKMHITSREIQYFKKTASDADCFERCRDHFSYDDEGNMRSCNASVRRRTSGECYLHAKGIEDAVPTKMATFVTYCKKDADAECKPKTSSVQLNIAGPELQAVRNTNSDAECFERCQEWDGKDKCTATVRRPSNGDCYLHAKTLDDAKPTGMRVYVTTCAS